MTPALVRSRRRSRSRTARGGACMRGQAPSNSPLSRLFVTRLTLRIYSVVVDEYIRAPIRWASFAATRARKGSMAQCVIDPQSSLVLLLARRVNSAAGERGLRRSAMRNYSAPVVTACSIDPPTRPNVNRLRCCGSARASLLPMPSASAFRPSHASSCCRSGT